MRGLESGALGRPVGSLYSGPPPLARSSPEAYISVTLDLAPLPEHIIKAFSVTPPCLLTCCSLAQKCPSSSCLLVNRLAPPLSTGTMRPAPCPMQPVPVRREDTDRVFMMAFISGPQDSLSVSDSVVTLSEKEDKLRLSSFHPVCTSARHTRAAHKCFAR